MIALLEDAQDFSLGAAKASHMVLLCRMGQGDIDKIDKSERDNAERHIILIGLFPFAVLIVHDPPSVWSSIKQRNKVSFLCR